MGRPAARGGPGGSRARGKRARTDEPPVERRGIDSGGDVSPGAKRGPGASVPSGPSGPSGPTGDGGSHHKRPKPSPEVPHVRQLFFLGISRHCHRTVFAHCAVLGCCVSLFSLRTGRRGWQALCGVRAAGARSPWRVLIPWQRRRNHRCADHSQAYQCLGRASAHSRRLPRSQALIADLSVPLAAVDRRHYDRRR